MTLRSQLRDAAYRRVGGSVVVLAYHRVAGLPTDPQALAVSPEHFEAQARMLAERYRVISLDEVADGLARHHLPRRAVAITFDDGYADNLRVAAPFLREHSLPATIFVSSGYTAGGREFWWDELERMLLAPCTLPERLELGAGAARFERDLDDARVLTAEDAGRHAGWTVLADPPTARHLLYLEVSAFVRGLDATEREEVLASLRVIAGPASARPSQLPLTVADLTALAGDPLIAIGGHTTDHVLLSALTPERQREEVQRDRERLTEVLGCAPSSFAYPYGGLADFTDASADAAREAGYRVACTTVDRPVKPWSDPYRLPRFLVRDWDAETLAARIDAWLEGPAVYARNAR